MEEMLPHIVEYGVLGLWTFSLLWRERQTENRHQSQLDKMEERHVAQTADFLALRDRIQENVIEELQENGHKLDQALDKLDRGLAEMQQKYAEDRMRMMSRGSDDKE